MAIFNHSFQRKKFFLILADFLSCAVAFIVGFSIRFYEDDFFEKFVGSVPVILVFAFLLVVANYLLGLYDSTYANSRFDNGVISLFAVMVTSVVFLVIAYFDHAFYLGRGVLTLSIILLMPLTLVGRITLIELMRKQNQANTRTLLLGDAGSSVEVLKLLRTSREFSLLNILGHWRPDPSPDNQTEFKRFVEKQNVQAVILALANFKNEVMWYPALRAVMVDEVTVWKRSDLVEKLSGRIPLEWVDEQWMMDCVVNCHHLPFKKGKRAFDIVFSVMALILSAPIMVLVYLNIAIFDGFPCLYKQVRVGRKGKSFEIYKFRTMRLNAETESGVTWASDEDPRITRMGRFLRKYRLDELPQFFNILIGDMSVIGPRPERPEFVEKLNKEIKFYDERHSVQPGLTGWAQVCYPYGASVSDSRDKLEYDLYYLKNMSFFMDLRVCLKTIGVILLGKERNMHVNRTSDKPDGSSIVLQIHECEPSEVN